jgi:hypothetical protein
LIGLAGRPSGTTTAANANITITGNTIENNGGATPVRGDGIAIGLEQDAVVNNLLIEDNTIRNNGDEGIDIRLGLQAIPLVNPTTARLTGTIRNNRIANNGQNGIQVEARGSTTARVTVTGNNSSNNGQRGIWILTDNVFLLGTPQIVADVRLNTLTGNPIFNFQAQTTNVPLAPQTMCINLTGNTLTNFNFTNSLGNTLAVVGTDLFDVAVNRNTGVTFASTTPLITYVPVCP